jgi:hypothetical protein
VIQLSVQVRGQLVRKGLQDLTAEIPLVGRQQMRTVAERIKRRMQTYPDEPEGQSVAETHSVLGTVFKTARGRYRRTGLLGRSWVIEQLPDNKGYKISNNAARKGRPYPQFVVGDAYGLRQAKIHQGRWNLFRDVTERETARLPQDITEQISLVARRRGFAQ